MYTAFWLMLLMSMVHVIEHWAICVLKSFLCKKILCFFCSSPLGAHRTWCRNLDTRKGKKTSAAAASPTLSTSSSIRKKSFFRLSANHWFMFYGLKLCDPYARCPFMSEICLSWQPQQRPMFKWYFIWCRFVQYT